MGDTKLQKSRISLKSYFLLLFTKYKQITWTVITVLMTIGLIGYLTYQYFGTGDWFFICVYMIPMLSILALCFIWSNEGKMILASWVLLVLMLWVGITPLSNPKIIDTSNLSTVSEIMK